MTQLHSGLASSHTTAFGIFGCMCRGLILSHDGREVMYVRIYVVIRSIIVEIMRAFPEMPRMPRN